MKRPANLIEIHPQDEHPGLPSGRRFMILYRKGRKWVYLKYPHDPHAARVRLHRAIFELMLVEPEPSP